MLTLRARWVLPVSSPPLLDGWVAIEGGRIAAVGQERRRTTRTAGEIDLGEVALMPGLVNAHTHLELSYLAGRVPAATRFVDWVAPLMAARREFPDPDDPRIRQAAVAAIDASVRAGVVLVGDVSNTLVTVPLLNERPLGGVVFHELLRFRAADAADTMRQADERRARVTPASHVRIAPAPHAPYSVSPRLFQAIRQALDAEPLARTTVHLGESAEELRLLEHGDGPWRDLLEQLGAWDDEWVAPECGPVEYLDRMRWFGPRVLAVHGVQLTDFELRRLAARRATLVTCPRSNRHVGVGDPSISRFYASGVEVAVGTDSLASAPDLNVFAELARMRELAPEVPAAALIESATLTGARALGFEATHGTLEPGKASALVAVQLHPRVIDVEEYLVSGIDASQISRVEAA
jgi:cytosine/adenosine deaminase-related metal-dependent hydrolase